MHRKIMSAAGIILAFAVTFISPLTVRADAVDMSKIDALTDAILDYIIQDDMDIYEQCCAVYDYVHKIPYINKVYSEDWQENGYAMLSYRAGDCFGYYSASRLLLEKLGFDVIKVENNNGFHHVWCLVSTDNGETWYHFDPTCWRWGYDGYLCMVTDEELSAYAHRHYVGFNIVSHDWDRQKVLSDIQTFEENENPEFFFLF